MDEDQQQQQQSPPSQQQPQTNTLELRLNEMAAVVEEMRRQQSEMQSEMQRQAALHELDRKRWHEECQQMQEERERLLRQAVATASPQKSSKCHSACRRIDIGQSTESGGLLATSRVIGSGKASSPHRPRSFHTLSEGFREKVLEIVRKKRHALASELQRYKQAVETDQTARALDALSLSEQSNRPNPTTSPLKLPSFSESEPCWNLSTYIEDISKQRRMQQQLASILHAQNCTSGEVDSMGNRTCPQAFCSVTTKVLEHMRCCSFVTRCPVSMCSLTREVMQHYKYCQTNGCAICQPVKLESTSTREQLIRFMDTICKGLGDDEVPVEAPTVPSIVDPAGDGLFSLASVSMPNIFVPTLLPPMATVAKMKEETDEAKMKEETDEAKMKEETDEAKMKEETDEAKMEDEDAQN